MKFRIEHVPEDVEHEVVIRCHAVDDAIRNLIGFLESPARTLLGFESERLRIIDPERVFYIESSDNKVFIHDDRCTYQSMKRLYELERDLDAYGFLRTSKSMVLNVRKIESVRPLFDGRLEARLTNGETAGISRTYVSALKTKIGL